MELHEIMSRAERDSADAAREGAQAPNAEANMAGVKKKGTTASSKQYILRSTLDSTIIEATSVYDIEIDDAEKAELALWRPNDEDCRPEGTLLTWKHGSANQLELYSIGHLASSFVRTCLVQLRTYLKRLRLPPGSAIPSNATSQTVKPLTIDAYLAQLVTQSYLDKQKTSLASAQGGQKRARGDGAVGGGDDGDASFEWKWGTRAIAKVREEGVGGFVVDFMDGIERERGNEGRRGRCARER
ncbi:hypothetical protein JB92DRAFT_65814 [Gautieria morchelliformis]|nr:hypothetical protein JB92DRAFT_65814 [Gautieria morchelliformis]